MIKSIGIAVPIEYARVINTVASESSAVAANVMTAAIIGPTHGVQIRPKLRPTNIPLKKPPPLPCCGASLAIGPSILSNSTVIFGNIKDSPRISNTTTATTRSASAETPVALTRAASASVKKVKLSTNPVTMPSGRFLSPGTAPDKMMGNKGKMHGERIVTIPAIKAKNIRINMIIEF